LFEAIIRALKNARIPVAGADRLVLTGHIAVMDLLVLADALLLPDDDLALATALKSPLFGLNDDHLFKLAWNRKTSLRDSLMAKAGDDPLFAAAAERLKRMSAAARRESPFAFYARVLGPEEGRKRFLARLGHEAADALDEFLNLALDYERRATPSLQGFAAWMRSVNSEIKRDMEIARDEVRVMTVHGAKGLEAPIVILADTCGPPGGPPQRRPRLLELPAVSAPPDTPNRFVWSARKDDDVAVIADARNAAAQAAEDEYRRLLYVAMTRAADRLVICGAAGANGMPEGCWYDLMFAALEPASIKETADDGEGEVWRFRKAPPEIETSAKPAATPVETIGLPDWLTQAARTEIPAFVTMTPSSAYDDENSQPRKFSVQSAQDRRLALARGTHIHRLLQSLPGIPPEGRAEAAQHYLARNATDFDAAQIKTIAAQALAVLSDARFAPLFAQGTRPEVPIVGRIERKGLPTILVSGQVDRLAVTDKDILIADYKTNRPAPRRLEDVPPAYVQQLALYRAVLAKVFPGRTLRAALLWTDVPDLIEISAAALDAAMAQVTRA
jgi:ATP-dependent helicase/nuclease subunit A